MVVSIWRNKRSYISEAVYFKSFITVFLLFTSLTSSGEKADSIRKEMAMDTLEEYLYRTNGSRTITEKIGTLINEAWIEKKYSRLGRLYNLYAEAYYIRQQFDSTILYRLMSMYAYKKSKMYYEEIIQTAYLGQAYSVLKENNKALHFDLRALQMMSEYPLPDNFQTTMLKIERMIDLGTGYLYINKLDTAKGYYLAALKLSLLYPDSEIARKNARICCINLVSYYLSQKDMKRADLYLKLGLRNIDSSDKYTLGALIETEGDILHEMGKSAEAYRKYEEALAIKAYSNWYDVRDHLYESLYKSGKTTGNYRMALYYLEKHFENQRKFDSLSNIGRINMIQQQLSTQKRELKLKAILKEKETGEILLKKEKKLNLLLLIVAVLVLILFTTYYLISIKRKKYIGVLKQKNATIRQSRRKLEQYNTLLINEKQTLEVENILAKFEVLKNQIQPHFLFNALHVLSSLIKEHSRFAGEYLNHLINILRYSLKINQDLLISVEEELALITSYIELFKFKHKNNFSYHIKVSSHARSLLIPPFTLQIIIENIFKHNTITDAFPLNLSLFDKDDCIVIQHQINKKISEEKAESFQIGYTNITKRYEILKAGKPEIRMDNHSFWAEMPIIGAE